MELDSTDAARLWVEIRRRDLAIYEVAGRVGTHPTKLGRVLRDLLDVPGAAGLLGMTEKAVRARVARRLLPHRKLNGRVVLIHRLRQTSSPF